VRATGSGGVIASLGPDGLEIVTDGGLPVAAAPLDGLRPGGVVDVVVRPEKIRLSEARPSPAANVFEGEVQDSVFQGVTIKYLVKLTGGAVVAVCHPNQGGVARGLLHRPGTKVFVAWDREASLVFASE
jgi:ABC-type Fe3+/spermidine/putrescine transport system ATPase subunit